MFDSLKFLNKVGYVFYDTPQLFFFSTVFISYNRLYIFLKKMQTIVGYKFYSFTFALHKFLFPFFTHLLPFNLSILG